MQAKENSINLDEQALRRVVGKNPKTRPYQSTYPIIRYWEEDKKPNVSGQHIATNSLQHPVTQEETMER